MKKIVQYLKDYFTETDKKVFLLSTAFIALAIFINYYTGLEKKLRTIAEVPQHVSWFLIFLCSQSFPYLLQAARTKQVIFNNRQFLFLLIAAPAIFAWKISANLHFHFTSNASENNYWNMVVYWPLKLAVVGLALCVIWMFLDRKDQPLYGLTGKHLEAKPYLIMLLIMVPLVALASTQYDFLQVYPKLKNVEFLQGENKGFYQLLYELSYGIDFVSIELFFRGFLILAFSKWVGKDSILPMALFYCTIHFGKPLGECISSFFGGLILGVVTFHTRTIYGGLIVHLGIAWMMELGGYLGSRM